VLNCALLGSDCKNSHQHALLLVSELGPPFSARKHVGWRTCDGPHQEGTFHTTVVRFESSWCLRVLLTAASAQPPGGRIASKPCVKCTLQA
jgi:hypothetical protein